MMVRLTKIVYANGKSIDGIKTISERIDHGAIEKGFNGRLIFHVNPTVKTPAPSINRRVILLTAAIIVTSLVIIFLWLKVTLSRDDLSEKSISDDDWMVLDEIVTPIGICANCHADEICMKIDEMAPPACRPMKDAGDPTGCGGWCAIDVEVCRVIDPAPPHPIHQCRRRHDLLHCKDDQYNCRNRCVPIGRRCDGRVDCADASDEYNCDCNLDTHFQCSNAISCHNKSQRCDGVIDCWDRSDEIGCHYYYSVRCIDGAFRCVTDGGCIAIDAFCDGHTDCVDGSDEPHGCQLLR